MNLILFGAPGSGKGTQSSLLIGRNGYVQVSTGDLFRAAIKNKTELGLKAQSYMDKGQLVPDSIVIDMVIEVIGTLKNQSFILDGFPRNVVQAEELGKILSSLDLHIGKAIFLEVPTEELLSRLTGRRVCKSCGAVYHVSSKPSKESNKCDSCGGEVIQRNDDKRDVIETRLTTYLSQTAPLKTYFKEKGLFVEINGNRDAELVYSDIAKIL